MTGGNGQSDMPTLSCPSIPFRRMDAIINYCALSGYRPVCQSQAGEENRP